MLIDQAVSASAEDDDAAFTITPQIMKLNLNLVRLLAGLLLATQAFSQTTQTAPKIDEKSQAVVDQLRAIVKEIKKCPKIVLYESKDKEGPFAGMRTYEGPTLNVEWDVAESKSTRSPYQGYVEAHVAWEFWLPRDVYEKYKGKMGNRVIGNLGYIKMFGGGPQPPLVYKYEFDLGPNGLELYRSFYRRSGETEFEDHKLAGGCWDEAVKNGLSGAGDRQQ